MKFKEECFLLQPEWQAILEGELSTQVSSVLEQTFRLKSKFCAISVRLPSLILNAQNEDYIPYNETSRLIEQASEIMDAIQKWLSVAEEFFQHHASRNPVAPYPNVLSGVMDCVAHTTLDAVHKIRQSLYMRLDPGAPVLNESTVLEWRRRSISSFQHVKAESETAAKPLEFGIRQISGSPEL
jgi:hypothetical protein